MVPSPGVSKSAQGFLVSTTGNLEYRFHRNVEKSGSLEPGVAVRLSHEVIADDCDSKFLFGRHELSKRNWRRLLLGVECFFRPSAPHVRRSRDEAYPSQRPEILYIRSR